MCIALYCSLVMFGNKCSFLLMETNFQVRITWYISSAIRSAERHANKTFKNSFVLVNDMECHLLSDTTPKFTKKWYTCTDAINYIRGATRKFTITWSFSRLMKKLNKNASFSCSQVILCDDAHSLSHVVYSRSIRRGHCRCRNAC